MPSTISPGLFYRVTNVTFNLMTLGVFTGRDKNTTKWPNAWKYGPQS